MTAAAEQGSGAGAVAAKQTNKEQKHEDPSESSDRDRDLPGRAFPDNAGQRLSKPVSGADPDPPTPPVAGATEPDHTTCGAIEDERHKWGPNVRQFPGNATRGTPHVARSGSDYTQTQLPAIKWFTFERRKVSTNTWAYCVRWYKLDHATGKYDRVAPICVRRVSDATDSVLRRRDNATLKNLVRQWYEEKIGHKFISAG